MGDPYDHARRHSGNSRRPSEASHVGDTQGMPTLYRTSSNLSNVSFYSEVEMAQNEVTFLSSGPFSLLLTNL